MGIIVPSHGNIGVYFLTMSARNNPPLVELLEPRQMLHGGLSIKISFEPQGLPLSPGYIADTEQEAFDIQWPYYAEAMNTEAKIRGWRSPVFEHYEAEATNGSMYIGSPETVAPRIADTICLLGLERFDLAYATGPMPHELKMKTIELYGREVIPRVREILADASDNDGTRAAEKVNR